MYILGKNKISAVGGLGGSGVPARFQASDALRGYGNCGGYGGVGRIRIDSVVFAGYIKDGAGEIYRSNMSSLFYVRTLHIMINNLRQSACLVFNPITVNNFASLFNCTPVGRASDSMMAPT